VIDTRKLWLLGMLVFVIGLCVGIRFEKDFLVDTCNQTGTFTARHQIYECAVTGQTD
jgi:hypothetical protein